MLSAASFLTNTLRANPSGSAISRIMAAALSAVDPALAVHNFVHRKGKKLDISGKEFDLTQYGRIAMLAMGKAAPSMAKAMAEILSSDLDEGLVITKHLPVDLDLPCPVILGDHPIPGEQSLNTGKMAMELISRLGPQDLLFCLISGGGSALVSAPYEGISLTDLQSMTSFLLATGAAIGEINSLRRRLDQIKGGGILTHSNRATVISLIISDVIGDPVNVIASGPTVPDQTSIGKIKAIVKKYDLENHLSANVLEQLLHKGTQVVPGSSSIERVQNLIVANNAMAAQAALDQASKEGFQTSLLRLDLQGEARQVAVELASILKKTAADMKSMKSPVCIVAGGETTVTLTGNGRGGRNSELALAAALQLTDSPNLMLVSLATDGEDGSTDSAGAVCNGDTIHNAAALGLDASEYLQRNDSYTFFSALGDLLKPGQSGTNVNDLVLMFAF